MPNSIKIALAQINPLVGDLENNSRKIEQYIDSAVYDYQADLIVFPELALTGYPPEDLLFREGFVLQAAGYLQELAEQAVEISVLLGYPRQVENNIYNSAAYLTGGAIQHIYDKQVLPNYGVFDEKRYFEPGAKNGIVQVKGNNIGISICEDIWQPEPVSSTVAAGAELILNINASPYHIGKPGERKAALLQRCEESRVPIVYVNLVGGQDELVFDGHSMAVNKTGDVVYQAPGFVESLGVVEFSAKGIEPVIPVATQEEDIAEVYRALSLAVKDYVSKNGFQGVVLGLSGGIDSALTLAVAVEALGAEQVEAVMMPSRYTSKISLEDAAKLAENLGVHYQEISIEPALQSFLGSLQSSLQGYAPDTTEENIQARCRGVILMAISNKKRRLVLATGNKSEMAVGYATLYGDMAGGFAPLKDVSKTWVYRLCEYINRNKEIIPRRIIERPPSAELAPDQKDEDSLPPYAVLDEILELYLEQEKSVESIISIGFDADVVLEVVRKVNLNEYKRRQAAPGVKITKRAFGRERRYPITCRL